MNKIDMNKRYKTRDGEDVRILCTDLDDIAYPVVAVTGKNNLETYTEYGKWHEDSVSNDDDLIEVSPYAHINIDDKVVVWLAPTDTFRHRGHYAGTDKQGKPMIFALGGTSFTDAKNGCSPSSWVFCELYDEEKHNV